MYTYVTLEPFIFLLKQDIELSVGSILENKSILSQQFFIILIGLVAASPLTS